MHITPEREAELSQQRELGSRASRLLEDPLFREAVEAIRNECRRSFETSKVDDDRGRLIARLKVDALEDVISKLVVHVRRGIMATDDLSLWETFREKMGKRKVS